MESDVNNPMPLICNFMEDSTFTFEYDYWGSMMKVVKKIESLRNMNVSITGKTCRIINFTNVLFFNLADTKEEAVLKAVVQFIKYHNFNNQNGIS